MNKIIGNVENFVWNNLKFYLLTYKSCLLDLILKVKDEGAEAPIDRYDDLLNELGKHMGLSSYVNVQPAQYSEIPYITVNIAAIPTGKCGARAVIGFDIVFSSDVPKAPVSSSTRYIGNSNESVAQFRADIVNALEQLFYKSSPDDQMANQFYDSPFWDILRDQEVANPVSPDEKKPWQYNMVGQVDDDYTISDVTQLRREVRSSAVSVFTVVFTIDVNKLYSDELDCGC